MNDERIDRVVEQFELRNEELESRIKALENHNIDNIIRRINGLGFKVDELETKNYQLKSDLDKLCNHIIDYLKEDKENTIKSNKALKNEAKKLGINLNEGDK
tara:strand:+ start:17 stop:322 length:306 start_codon:yes stop_codon:yes gene_type:complete